ncbi:MAG TPA: cob(I)yrinic acid a,c-diamide adenosyltransferase [Acidimicrobiales bacterium]|nr:cob(I)yrinic acid a,c-diamide adenosyltransferase [Acidimicrobiales bacterium]
MSNVAMAHYTGKGDDGTTGLLYGGRVPKDSALPTAYGAVDEAQAFIGLARAQLVPGTEIDDVLVHVARDLWVLMAELATLPENRHKLTPGASMVDTAMLDALEHHVEAAESHFEVPKEFVVPGQNAGAAALDVARTVVRRAERHAVSALDDSGDSLAIPYLNRLSSLLWALARWAEGDSTLRTKDVR